MHGGLNCDGNPGPEREMCMFCTQMTEFMMWNSRIVLAFMASCLLFYSIISGDEPNGVRSNLAATADELSRAYSVESEITPSPNSNPATEEIATSDVSPRMPPLPPVGSDNSKPCELTLNRILPAVPEVESVLNFEIVLPGPEHESAPIHSVEPWSSEISSGVSGFVVGVVEIREHTEHAIYIGKILNR